MTAPQTEATGLPTHVESRTLIEKAAPGWNLLPLGVQENRDIVGIDLKESPHTLLVAPTGSGRVSVLRHMMVAALLRDFDVRLVDPFTGGIEFHSLAPWTGECASTFGSTAAAVESVYETMRARRMLLKEHGVVRWSDLPAEVAGREENRRILLVLDEYDSIVRFEDARGLPADHPLRAEIVQETESRAKITVLTGRLAREGRFAGIHLLVAAQRATADTVGGEMRENLGHRILMCRRGHQVSPVSAAVVFESHRVAEATGLQQRLDDQHRGLAILATGGGGLIGYRAAVVLDNDDATSFLTEAQVPRRTA